MNRDHEVVGGIPKWLFGQYERLRASIEELQSAWASIETRDISWDRPARVIGVGLPTDCAWNVRNECTSAMYAVDRIVAEECQVRPDREKIKRLSKKIEEVLEMADLSADVVRTTEKQGWLKTRLAVCRAALAELGDLLRQYKLPPPAWARDLHTCADGECDHHGEAMSDCGLRGEVGLSEHRRHHEKEWDGAEATLRDLKAGVIALLAERRWGPAMRAVVVNLGETIESGASDVRRAREAERVPGSEDGLDTWRYPESIDRVKMVLEAVASSLAAVQAHLRDEGGDVSLVAHLRDQAVTQAGWMDHLKCRAAPADKVLRGEGGTSSG